MVGVIGGAGGAMGASAALADKNCLAAKADEDEYYGQEATKKYGTRTRDLATHAPNLPDQESAAIRGPTASLPPEHGPSQRQAPPSSLSKTRDSRQLITVPPKRQPSPKRQSSSKHHSAYIPHTHPPLSNADIEDAALQGRVSPNVMAAGICPPNIYRSKGHRDDLTHLPFPLPSPSLSKATGNSVVNDVTQGQYSEDENPSMIRAVGTIGALGVAAAGALGTLLMRNVIPDDASGTSEKGASGGAGEHPMHKGRITTLRKGKDSKPRSTPAQVPGQHDPDYHGGSVELAKRLRGRGALESEERPESRPYEIKSPQQAEFYGASAALAQQAHEKERREERERLERDRREKELREKERREKDRREKERRENDRRERMMDTNYHPHPYEIKDPHQAEFYGASASLAQQAHDKEKREKDKKAREDELKKSSDTRYHSHPYEIKDLQQSEFYGASAALAQQAREKEKREKDKEDSEDRREEEGTTDTGYHPHPYEIKHPNQAEFYGASSDLATRAHGRGALASEEEMRSHIYENPNPQQSEFFRASTTLAQKSHDQEAADRHIPSGTATPSSSSKTATSSYKDDLGRGLPREGDDSREWASETTRTMGLAGGRAAKTSSSGTNNGRQTQLGGTPPHWSLDQVAMGAPYGSRDASLEEVRKAGARQEPPSSPIVPSPIPAKESSSDMEMEEEDEEPEFNDEESTDSNYFRDLYYPLGYELYDVNCNSQQGPLEVASATNPWKSADPSRTNRLNDDIRMDAPVTVSTTTWRDQPTESGEPSEYTSTTIITSSSSSSSSSTTPRLSRPESIGEESVASSMDAIYHGDKGTGRHRPSIPSAAPGGEGEHPSLPTPASTSSSSSSTGTAPMVSGVSGAAVSCASDGSNCIHRDSYKAVEGETPLGRKSYLASASSTTTKVGPTNYRQNNKQGVQKNKSMESSSAPSRGEHHATTEGNKREEEEEEGPTVIGGRGRQDSLPELVDSRQKGRTERLGSRVSVGTSDEEDEDAWVFGKESSNHQGRGEGSRSGGPVPSMNTFSSSHIPQPTTAGGTGKLGEPSLHDQSSSMGGGKEMGQSAGLHSSPSSQNGMPSYSYVASQGHIKGLKTDPQVRKPVTFEGRDPMGTGLHHRHV
ncbi:MAG: hypothetical protein DHS80DRAFT_21269 [Piptocephalis tieghemiana]|nr:MAG: hypothetical protein DHS80DRAFT_21269 [Piptocephalis tieghemiana]